MGVPKWHFPALPCEPEAAGPNACKISPQQEELPEGLKLPLVGRLPQISVDQDAEYAPDDGFQHPEAKSPGIRMHPKIRRQSTISAPNWAGEQQALHPAHRCSDALSIFGTGQSVYILPIERRRNQ
ncbi:hypothetical protein ASE23_25770 [Rhizobium sp. Root73]|nr:hypothetical protein ASD36_25235 [Rhizobium sp. Root1334]KRC06351.1 hypothetical protein ASE23_25770 [Rhizobium sp. Root73]